MLSNLVGVPQPWLDELSDSPALVTDSDGRAAVLNDMASAARRRWDVDDSVLSDMLELVEAARTWAFLEREEAFHIGLLAYESADEWEGNEPGQNVVGRAPEEAKGCLKLP